MSKVIIGIHGLGNKPPKPLLEEWWKVSILEGFKNAGIEVPKITFELVYWADLVHDKPEQPDIKDETSPYFIYEPYVPSQLNKQLRKVSSFRKKALSFIEKQMESVFLNEDFSLNFKSVSDIVIHSYFKELEMYYGTSIIDISFQQQTRKRLLDVIQKYRFDDIMIIGHSMGSIIAYDVLQFELKKQCIHTFATFGSPLGLPFIRASIANEMRNKNPKFKIATPKCVSNNWCNFSDLVDILAINFDLSNNFEANSFNVSATDFEVLNDYEYKGIKNPHKAYGYLRNKEFITLLDVFLKEKQKFSLRKLFIYFQKLWYQFDYKKLLKNIL